MTDHISPAERDQVTPMVLARATVTAIQQASLEGSVPLGKVAADLEFARTIALVSIADSLESIARSIGHITVDTNGRIRVSTLQYSAKPH